MKRNIIFYLISLICGILFCYFLKIEHFTKFYIFLVLSVTCLFSYIFRFNKIRLFLFMLSLGFLVSFFSEKESNLKSFFDQEVSLTGEVLNSTARSDGDGFRHEVRLKNIENTEKTEKILLFTNHKQFEIGDIVSVTGKLREIKSNGNPRLFNYKRFNLKKKIFSNIYSDDVKKIGENKNLKRDFHKFAENVFDTFLSTDNSNIMKRIFLANNYDADFENNIREIGLSHILAVSGLHIGIIYLILSKILVILPIKRLFREIIILFFIFLYAYLIGNPASVLRAEIFLFISIFSSLYGKVKDRLNDLFLTIFVILLINPYMIFDVGLYLSAFSVLGIIKILPYFSKKRDGFILKSLKLTFSVMLIILPIILYTFGKFSIITFFSNLILTPIFVICIVISFFILLFGLLSLKICAVLGLLVNNLLNLIRLNVDFLKDININITFYEYNIVFVIFTYFLLLVYFKRRDFKYFSFGDIKFLTTFVMIVFAFSNVFYIYKNEVNINFIDIGQGDACLIRGKQNNILIDTGGITFGKGDNGKSVLIPYLQKHGVKKLDFVFISHLDADHCKNLSSLSKEVKIKNLFFRKDGYRDFVKKYGEVKAENIYNIENNLKLNLEDVSLEVLKAKDSTEENERSIIVRVTVNGKKILFTGDIGAFTENQLIKNDIDCDYLKVAHHGSKNSSSPNFLSATSPKASIISCGYKNRYNHPHKDALDRIKSTGSDVFRTDLQGNIMLRINKFEEKIESFREIDGNLFGLLNFYFMDVLNITMYLFAFFVLVKIKNDSIIDLDFIKEEL
ncbi:DNA internalization-related competence protein ComEC/Rec2 [Parvimonas sp. C2]|uniref:DNA internalization-related competence protein ComEC/Rec2 n=1 Tax=Parvimonas sp. C2 TaxID=3110692 RepID=UPI002B4969CA|nr:DNA internalization-related competence protein ComEC/Rec2 [Parvimonas sp. C2]MEB3072475.1 DNA internalization-related competence protein ComEC/Rec2 [Parvimonas sp. C2]